MNSKAKKNHEFHVYQSKVNETFFRHLNELQVQLVRMCSNFGVSGEILWVFCMSKHSPSDSSRNEREREREKKRRSYSRQSICSQISWSTDMLWLWINKCESNAHFSWNSVVPLSLAVWLPLCLRKKMRATENIRFMRVMIELLSIKINCPVYAHILEKVIGVPGLIDFELRRNRPNHHKTLDIIRSAIS